MKEKCYLRIKRSRIPFGIWSPATSVNVSKIFVLEFILPSDDKTECAEAERLFSLDLAVNLPTSNILQLKQGYSSKLSNSKLHCISFTLHHSVTASVILLRIDQTKGGIQLNHEHRVWKEERLPN